MTGRVNARSALRLDLPPALAQSFHPRLAPRYSQGVRELLRRHRRFFLLFTLAGLALRVFFAVKFAHVTTDSLLYADIAKNWLTHGIYGQTDSGAIVPTLIRLPGYPAFLAIVFKLFGMENYRAVITLQVICDLGTCFLLADAARRWFEKTKLGTIDDRPAQAAFALTALCPFLANYTAAVLTETLEVFFTALALNFAIRGLFGTGLCGADTLVREMPEQKAKPEFKPYLPWIAGGLATGAAILLRPDGGLLLAAIGAYLVIAFLLRNRKQEIIAALVFSVATLACLLPWTVRNSHTFGLFQPLAPRYANMPNDFVPHGFNHWTKTWIADYVSTEEFYWAEPGEELDVDKLPQRAFDSYQQFQQTQDILDDYNTDHDLSPELDARFEALAQERIQRSPFRYWVRLPLLRMADMWLRPRTELLPADTRWWEFDDGVFSAATSLGLGLLNLAYLLAAALGLARLGSRKLGLPWHTAHYAALLLLFFALRTLFLGSLENPEPRYTLEAYPAVILAAAACWRTRDQQSKTTEIRRSST